MCGNSYTWGTPFAGLGGGQGSTGSGVCDSSSSLISPSSAMCFLEMLLSCI